MLWIKAFHLVAVISWFATLFYLPRLFVYHAATTDAPGNERFKIMEKKLYRQIGTPAMLATLVLGFWMVWLGWDYYKTQGWFHAKLLLVFLMIGYHHVCGAHIKRFARDANTKSHLYFRYFNEIPIIFLVSIVILVIVKPF